MGPARLRRFYVQCIIFHSRTALCLLRLHYFPQGVHLCLSGTVLCLTGDVFFETLSYPLSLAHYNRRLVKGEPCPLVWGECLSVCTQWLLTWFFSILMAMSSDMELLIMNMFLACFLHVFWHAFWHASQARQMEFLLSIFLIFIIHIQPWLH